MATLPVRSRASSAPIPRRDENISPTFAAALDRTGDLLGLLTTEQLGEDVPFDAYAESQCDRLRELHVLLIDSSHQNGQIKDNFRRFGGFDALLNVARNLTELARKLGPHRTVFDLLKLILHVLSVALYDNAQNRAYFAAGDAKQGWQLLEQTLLDLQLSFAKIRDLGWSVELKILSLLLAFALGKEGESSAMASLQVREQTPATEPSDGGSFSKHADIAPSSRSTSAQNLILWNPEAIRIVARLWLAFLETGSGPLNKKGQDVSTVVLSAFQSIFVSSHYNAVSFHECGAIEVLLKILDLGCLQYTHYDGLIRLVRQHLRLGLHSSSEARGLFRLALLSKRNSESLTESVRAKQNPSHFVFDLSLHGYSSLELSELRGTFPPDERSGGYTLMMWIRIDEYDARTHTTLFGAFDPSQTCFLLLYLERETCRLVLQTSVASDRPSVRFKSIDFAPDRWYHVAIVHQTPRSDGVSRAVLYVNGEFYERVKCLYPQRQTTHAAGSSRSQRHQSSGVQAFLGTPKGLATRLGTGVSSSRWSLASCQLVLIPLSDELLLIYHNLGPSYVGNFQDSLGSFQTYRTSTALNLRNEYMHTGTAERSTIAKAIKTPARAVNGEQNFALNIIASSMPGKEFRRVLVRCEMYRDRISGFSIQTADLRARLDPMIPLNIAVTRLRDNNAQLASLVTPLGGMRLASSRSVSNFSWQVCGSVALAVKSLEDAESENDIIRAIDLVFGLVQDNWRISEAFEKENAFSIMAWLLRSKAVFRKRSIDERLSDIESEPLSLRVLRIILNQIGYNEHDTQASVISNPLAYRALIVDSDIWRSMEGVTQRLYYKQFVDVISNARFSQFNIKRLVRMRILKRLIAALKSETINKEGVTPMLQALKHIIIDMPSSEAYRSIALYITFAVSMKKDELNAPAGSHSSRRQSSGPQSQRLQKSQSTRSFGETSNSSKSSQRVSTLELGISVLKMLVNLVCIEKSDSQLRKFSRAVTNKWVLYLLSSDHPDVIACCCHLLARLLVLQGASYVAKFDETTKGFLLLRKRLKRWWHLDIVWNCGFAIAFGIDTLELNALNNLDSSKISALISGQDLSTMYCSAMVPVLVSMLEAAVTSHGNSSMQHTGPQDARAKSGEDVTKSDSPAVNNQEAYSIISDICTLFRDVYVNIKVFREFAVSSNFSRDVMRALFARFSNAESISSPIEGRCVPDILTIDEAAGKITPDAKTPVKRPSSESSSRLSQTPSSRRRNSSFVMVQRSESLQNLSSIHGHTSFSLVRGSESTEALQRDQIFNLITTLLVDIFTNQILDHKDFTGLGLFFKAPPCAYDQRAAVNSHLILMTMRRLQTELKFYQSRIHETKVLMNIARFSQQAFEAYMEGWFVHGALPIIEFNLLFVNHLKQPRVQNIKDVRLCSPSITCMQSTMGRASLFHITTSSEPIQSLSRLDDLLDLPNWNEAIIREADVEESCFGPFCCAILRILPGNQEEDLSRAQLLLTHFVNERPDEFVSSFMVEGEDEQSNLFNDFLLCLRDGLQSLSSWLPQNSQLFQRMISDAKDRTLMPFIAEEERVAAKSAEVRSIRRKERLEQWHLEDLAISHSWTEHQISSKNWTENIINAELHKYHKSLQDQQEGFEHLKFQFDKLVESLETLRLTSYDPESIHWQLDECEGRDRMRLRLSPLLGTNEVGYEPKTTRSMRRATQSQSRSSTKINFLRKGDSVTTAGDSVVSNNTQNETPPAMDSSKSSLETGRGGFEIITEPGIDEEEEDKNRKVMRSLQRGEQVLNVFNISRIVGLEAREGLLIVGKTSLYLVDGLFQRSDGEVVNVEQAPSDERDQYTEILSGHEVDLKHIEKRKQEPTRHWLWSDILSFSKRNFLTRPVAIELFFTDGRSYLLTTNEEEQRNSLYSDLTKHTNQARNEVLPEHREVWRAELLKGPSESTSRFSSFLSPMITNPVTKKWIKGDISNFHYLMWVNSQAGRTFNDLTQYPVFPWVIADYTSDELDVSNPRSFRDLTKPMGCQTIERSESFRERYTTLAEMDEHTPPFHYGTHYSSAMIVTSFLIRLQPFVQSHVLLQGGSFDHANRLFHSVEQAWRSASREGLSDVRELIPEFYYLPDFLKNVNKYNFGFREGDNEIVNHVKLPPWAKEDPEIFINKHREALESPYVSQNLHAWIDLVFGFKQRGEAAVEATNVFHYLSYPGAKDLDRIHDKHERAATIGIIHNFGQTPKQIFMRPHDRRDQTGSKSVEVTESMGSLARLRAPVQDLGGAISRLQYDRQLIATVCGTCLVPGINNVIVDWAYPDQSVRFWTSDRKKMLALYEQLHDKAILTALFINQTIFMTAAEDGTVSAWKARMSSDSIELHPKITLFGHQSSVRTLTFSKAYSVILTGSTDGMMILWDLSRMEYIRRIDCNTYVRDARVSDNSGRILVCGEVNAQIFTLNGRRLLDQKVCDKEEGSLTSCSFYQHSGNAWFETEICLTGHEKGVIKIWRISTTRDGTWSLVLVNRLTIDNPTKDHGSMSVTALLGLDHKVWAGDEQGKVFEWNAVR